MTDVKAGKIAIKTTIHASKSKATMEENRSEVEGEEQSLHAQEGMKRSYNEGDIGGEDLNSSHDTTCKKPKIHHNDDDEERDTKLHVQNDYVGCSEVKDDLDDEAKSQDFDESTANAANPPNSTTQPEDAKTDDEKRMEINRLRAREIRKKKKQMLKDMEQQIILLTLENNRLRTQSQMYQTEINLLRNFSTQQVASSSGALGSSVGGALGSSAALIGNTNNSNLNNLLLSQNNGTSTNYNNQLQRLIPQRQDNTNVASLLSRLTAQQAQQQPSQENLVLSNEQQNLIARLRDQHGGTRAGNSRPPLMTTRSVLELPGTNEEAGEQTMNPQSSVSELLGNTVAEDNTLGSNPLFQRFLNPQQQGTSEATILSMLLEQQRKQNNNNSQSKA